MVMMRADPYDTTLSSIAELENLIAVRADPEALLARLCDVVACVSEVLNDRLVVRFGEISVRDA